MKYHIFHHLFEIACIVYLLVTRRPFWWKK